MPISRHMRPIKIKFLLIILLTSSPKNILDTEPLPTSLSRYVENIQLYELCTIFRNQKFSIARESFHTNNYIENSELPSSPNHAADIPSSPGDLDSSQDHDIIPDGSADVSPRNSAHSSCDSTFLYLGFTFLHPTPSFEMYPSHSAHRLHQTIDTISPSTSQLSAPSFLNSCPMRNNPIKLNTNNVSSNLPPVVYMIISPEYCASTPFACSLIILSSQQYYLIIILAFFRLQIIYYLLAATLLIMKQLFTNPSLSPSPLITNTQLQLRIVHQPFSPYFGSTILLRTSQIYRHQYQYTPTLKRLSICL